MTEALNGATKYNSYKLTSAKWQKSSESKKIQSNKFTEKMKLRKNNKSVTQSLF